MGDSLIATNLSGASRDELVVLSWGGRWDRALRVAVSDPFEAQTGIAVRHRLHVGLRLPEDLLHAAGGAARPPVDVVWCNGVAALAAVRSGLCDSLAGGDMANLDALHPRAMPDAAQMSLVMAYAVTYVLVFRRAAFADGPPTSWSALVDPRHSGRIALYPDANGLHAVAQVLGGGQVADIPGEMEPCWRFLKRLAPRVKELAYSVGMEETLRAGELDLCVRALPNALGFQQAGVDVDWVAPIEGVPDTMDAFWVPRGLDPQSAARSRRYIDFMLSRTVHERWCALLGVLPVRRDAAVPAVLSSRAGHPSSLDADDANLLYVPDLVKLERASEWTRRFRLAFGHDEHHDTATDP